MTWLLDTNILIYLMKHKAPAAIACHGPSIDATLVTNNIREFSRIDGLPLQNWVE